MKEARYFVGLDLGTTHSALSYLPIETKQSEAVEVLKFAIPQLLSPGEVVASPLLPSFLYQSHALELGEEDRRLPWSVRPISLSLTGEIARALGSKTPIRMISSAKSWLSHPGVNRREAFLPVQAPEDVARLSPFEASARYLEHLREAWNAQFPDAPLESQILTLTVPASFDPAARELTVEAARSVGLGHAVLLEEPQAAFYSWLQASGGRWREQVQEGEILLVVDIGGGTTDFSLIQVSQISGALALTRIAIGDHILLGGDNMDLALAFRLREKLKAQGHTLESWQVQALTQACRNAKEQLLLEEGPEAVPIAVPGRGASLIGSVLRTELTRSEVQDILIEGFFPVLSILDQPQTKVRSGLTSQGLPYAQDPRVTSHLAAFLSQQREALGSEAHRDSPFIKPNAVLLNGGVFKSRVLSDRLLKVLNQWLLDSGSSACRLLSGVDLDAAVAQGAAYFGLVRQGSGIRIRGGTAAAYYVGVESALPAVPGFSAPLEALCIAPFGLEEGSDSVLLPEEFGVVVGEPVQFKFFSSKTRRQDEMGTRIEWIEDAGLSELTDIEVVLPEGLHQAGEIVPVQLSAKVTELGTLCLEAVSKRSEARWKVELDVRESPAG